MKKKRNKLVGKIGWCDKETLGLGKDHYVFIRNQYGNKCSVNTLTSLKNKNGYYKIHKIRDIENGIVYPIPKKDITLPIFSGVHKNTIKNVPVSKIRNIGTHQLKRRHHHYIRKYVKK